MGHLAGVIDTDGHLHVLINGNDVGQSERTRFFSHFIRRPGGFTIGADPSATVTGVVHNQFSGQIEDVRLYWGIPGETLLRQWTR